MSDTLTNSKKFRLAVLISGSGTTMVNLQKEILKGNVPAEIVVVVSSRSGVLGLERAKELGLKTEILGRKRFRNDSGFDNDAYSNALKDLLLPYKPDLAVMAGFMTKLGSGFVDVISTVNVHPALLPSFGGEGFYGHHVHEAVLKSGVKLSGATVHFADCAYDRGPIIMQKSVPVLEWDTPDLLADRVQEVEREIYPRAIALIAKGLVKIDGEKTVILKNSEEKL
ncbi:MAG: phosphoribosylglycinamide formyltransferase [Deltaproteobacteria bacterium]|nr:phosphoribosylglycinamide formyltransferase [Deltaproteobacteria bacterium]